MDVILTKLYAEDGIDFGRDFVNTVQTNLELIVRLIRKWEPDFDINNIQFRAGGTNTAVCLLDNHVIQIFGMTLRDDVHRFFDFLHTHQELNTYIVTIFEHGYNYVVMEKVEPINDECVYDDKRDNMDLATHFKVLNNLCSGLSIINRYGFFHGDVSYDNAGLSKNGNYKIYDFGGIRMEKRKENYGLLFNSAHSKEVDTYFLFVKQWIGYISGIYPKSELYDLYVYSLKITQEIMRGVKFNKDAIVEYISRDMD